MQAEKRRFSCPFGGWRSTAGHRACRSGWAGGAFWACREPIGHKGSNPPVLPWGITVTFLPFTGESYQPVKRYPGLGVGGVRWISGVVTV